MGTAEPTAAKSGLRICLAASGGGHVRQLLDLQPVWGEYDHFFVTEDTALGASLARDHRTHFVPHFAWGQAKQGSVFRMLGLAFASFFRSAAIMLRERPDLVISTGAGAVIFAVLWGRLIGARVVVIESFARFEAPSLFGRMAAPLAHDLVVQSAKLAPFYPRAKVFDPFRMLDKAAPPKDAFLFATVGATLPFDRLVDSVAAVVADGTLSDEVLIQTGVGGRRPDGLRVVETLGFDEVQELLKKARVVVCHGGTGSLITALREGCHVISMPRLAELGEHYDDHQAEITDAFVQRGLVLQARNVDDLRAALAETKTRTPVLATTDPRELRDFLDGVIGGLTRRAAADA
ncbi:MAG: hypothetical protein JNL41_09605 [Phenylobacterium sp.]|uniref:beta-1,4-glucuronosyltransferase WelK n=1 Tax=Phenylobacterium sp. TaxID=1871053 RepID=UPI001A3EB8D7|nr:glycosyltransferase [Phenylobacterium sp.]MBL8554521.1 hypothetical protein [Phenylobacterium sp.]